MAYKDEPGGILNRNLLLAVLAFTAAGFCSPSAAQNLTSVEQLYSALPPQAEIPSPPVPLRAAPSYLSGAASLSGEKLFQYLHQVTEYPPAGTGTDYLKAKKYMFSVADNTGCNGAPGVMAFYSQVCVKGESEHGADYKERGDENGDGIMDSGGMNAEHSWPQGFFNNGQIFKPQKIHFHKPQIFNTVHFKLSDNGVWILRSALKRNHIGERFFGNYDAAGVR